MDARDRLRRYLEQRRELGESEFVLDGLSIEDAMRLLGVRGSGAANAPARGGRVVAPASDEPPRVSRPAASATSSAADDQEIAAPPPPPAPDVRFDAQASTDWRETLRQAGTKRPDGEAGTPPTPAQPASERTSAPAPVGSTASAASLSGVPALLPDWLAALDVPAGLEAGAVRVQDVLPDVAALPSLEAVAQHIAACQRCGLHKTARNPVPGEGHPQAELLCVGEAPGANEDTQGRPFVGEAGQLLTKILAAIQLGREDVFIHNVLKHRPPGNRDPNPEEVLACQPYLLRQIELVRPRVILALGRFAAQTLLQTGTGIGALRGRIHRFHGVPLIVTYHPAALLRNEAWKRPTWEDVKLARRVLDAARAAEPQRSFE